MIKYFLHWRFVVCHKRDATGKNVGFLAKKKYSKLPIMMRN